MKGLLKFVVLLLVVAAAVGFFSSKDYQVERSIIIAAPPEAVHAYVGHLEKWPEWTPWTEEDPTIETTFGDKTTGVGAHQSWTGKDGEGELTFTQCDAKSGIAYEMAFIEDGKRFPANSSMTYKPAADGGTEVVWSMEGNLEGNAPPVVDGWLKIMMPFMVGGMFDSGLEKLKAKVEAQNG